MIVLALIAAGCDPATGAADRDQGTQGRNPVEQAAALELARCVRDHGISDFPDPAAGDALIDTTKMPSTERAGGMAALDAAIKACHPFLAEATGGRG